MALAICLGLLFPLFGFLGIMASSRSIGRQLCGVVGSGSIFISFLCFASLAYTYSMTGAAPFTFTLFNWIHLDKINADFTLHFDPLTILMTLIITGVGFLIHVYSIGYMEHDKDYPRFFASMNFFVFAMLLLVLAGDLLVLFVGWEGVGLASYLLIGYYYEKPSAAQAATKAFVVNRVGDLGFLLGLILAFTLFGTGNIEVILENAGKNFSADSTILSVLALLLFIGAIGKSAQIPLHVWLPDAMEGPTPVSALIHAATMVTAGVYLVVRMHSLYLIATPVLHFIGALGGATALFAALCAIGQTDLKRVLAYSTVSQLGYMFLACGVGAFFAAMFHLMTHAFMKALLFLSAGNVVHMMHDTTEMGQMGGLAKKFTKTHWLFLVGVLAMSGIPPLAAFFSKDLILEQDYLAGYLTLFYIGVITSIITAFYLTRAYFLTFMGDSHVAPSLSKDLKEAPAVMVIPVTILAILSIVGGFFGFTFGKEVSNLENFLSQVGVEDEEFSSLITPETILSIACALFGVLVAAFIYSRYAERLGPPLKLLNRSFFIDEFYEAIFVNPLKKISKFIDDYLEPKIFEGSLKMTASATGNIATWMQQMQSGQLRSYVAWMAVGTVILVAYLVLHGV